MNEDKNSSNLPPVDDTGAVDVSSAPVNSNRQALFTPEPEAPEATVASGATSTQPSVNLSHPYFSNHPTQTFNTDTGDIILNPAGPKPKQNKRPFIIGGAILAGFILIVATVLLLLPKDNDITNKNSSVAKERFNQFATYLLYGKTENRLTGEYEDDKSYELDLQLERETVDENYWEKSAELLGNAVASATEDQSVTRYLVKSLQSYQQNFDFIRAYRRNGDLDEERLLASYVGSGANTAKTLIDTFYSKYGNADSSITQNYVDQRKTQYGDLINIFAIYNELGCIKNGVISDKNCTGNPSQEMMEQFVTLSESIGAAQDNAEESVQKSIQYLKSRCWELSEWLQNPIDERDGENNEE